MQRRLYAEALAAHRAKIAASDSKRIGQAMLGMLHHLRVLCAHPVAMGQVADISQPLHEARAVSPKLDWLISTLENIKRQEEKVIVFTELRDIQRVLQHYIGERFGRRPVIVNGDTDARSDRGTSRHGSTARMRFAWMNLATWKQGRVAQFFPTTRSGKKFWKR